MFPPEREENAIYLLKETAAENFSSFHTGICSERVLKPLGNVEDSLAHSRYLCYHAIPSKSSLTGIHLIYITPFTHL